MVELTRSFSRKSSLDFGDTRRDLDTLFGVRSALDAQAGRQIDLEGGQFDLDTRRRLAREAQGVDEALRQNVAEDPGVTAGLRRLSATPGAGALAQQGLQQERETETAREKEILQAYQDGNPAMAQALEARYGLNPLPDQFKADVNAAAGAAGIIDEAGELYGDSPAQATRYVQLRIGGATIEQAIAQAGEPSERTKLELTTVMQGDQPVRAFADPTAGTISVPTAPGGGAFAVPPTGQGQQPTALQKNIEYLMTRFGMSAQQAFNAAKQSASHPAWLRADEARQRVESDLRRAFGGRIISPEEERAIAAQGQKEFDTVMDFHRQNDPFFVEAIRPQPAAPVSQQVGGGQSFGSLTQIPAQELQTQTQETVAPAAAPPQPAQPGQSRRLRFDPGVGIVPQ